MRERKLRSALRSNGADRGNRAQAKRRAEELAGRFAKKDSKAERQLPLGWRVLWRLRLDDHDNRCN